MPPKKASTKKATAESESTMERIHTRSKNTNAHPGTAGMAALKVRRDPEVIKKEKQQKKEDKESKERKQHEEKTQEEAAKRHLEEYRAKQRADAEDEELALPRQRSKSSKSSLPAHLEGSTVDENIAAEESDTDNPVVERVAVAQYGGKKRKMRSRAATVLSSSEIEEVPAKKARGGAQRPMKSRSVPLQAWKDAKGLASSKVGSDDTPTAAVATSKQGHQSRKRQDQGGDEDADAGTNPVTPARPQKKAKVSNETAGRRTKPLRRSETTLVPADGVDTRKSKKYAYRRSQQPEDEGMGSGSDTEPEDTGAETEPEEDNNQTPRQQDFELAKLDESEVEVDADGAEPYSTPELLRRNHEMLPARDQDPSSEEELSEIEEERQRKGKQVKSISQGGKSHLGNGKCSVSAITVTGREANRSASGKAHKDREPSSAPTAGGIPGPLSVSAASKSRTTASNNVALIGTSAMVQTSKAKQKRVSKGAKDTNKPQAVKVRSDATDSTTTGLEDGDDTLDRQAALESPVKGKEARNSCSIKVTRESQTIPLPPRTERDFKGIVTPYFLAISAAKRKPFFSPDVDSMNDLQDIWNRVFPEHTSYKITNDTDAWKIAKAQLSQYRNRMGGRAVVVVQARYLAQYATDEEKEVALNDIEAKIEFGTYLCTPADFKFIFKGIEEGGKKTGRFQSSSVLETFVIHFALATPKKMLPNFEVGEPYSGLALAVAAVERALLLWRDDGIVRRVDKKGRITLVAKDKKDFSQQNYSGMAGGWLKNVKRHTNTQMFSDVCKKAQELAGGMTPRTLSIRTEADSDSDDSDGRADVLSDCDGSEGNASGEN